MTDKPIFIGGGGSSGSTLLSLMLNCHPEIACGPEMSFFNKKAIYCVDFQVFRRNFEKWSLKGLNTDGYWLYPGFLLNRDYYGLENDQISAFLKKSNGLRGFTDLIIEHYLRKANKVRFAEKTPSNAYCFREIVQLYPDAKLIHLHRDGRDAFCSFKKKVQHPFIASSGWLYNTTTALTCEKLPNYFETSYESLTADPEKTLKAICEHIEVEYSDQMITPSNAEMAEKTRKGQDTWSHSPGDAISTSSVGRHKNEMTVVDKSIFWNTVLTEGASQMLGVGLSSTREVMGRLGYPFGQEEAAFSTSLKQRLGVEKIYFTRLLRSIRLGRGLIHRKTRLR